MYSIEAKKLSKIFDKKKNIYAVSDLSFQISPGESVAFLGPNGAGKSTTIKMLCGILTPTSGESTIIGFKSGEKEAAKVLGLVFGTRSQLYMHMTVSQCLELIGEIYFLKGVQKKSRIGDLASLFEIENILDKRVRTLSLGQRMRCEIVAALLHRPKVLLADEPTIGLDIVAKNKLRELIMRWQREEKSTLLLTSHDLSDVEALCERCILINNGQKKFDGKLIDLKGNMKDVRRVQIILSEEKQSPDLKNNSFEQSKELFGLSLTNIENKEGHIHSFEIDTCKTSMSVALAFLSQYYGNYLRDINISEVSLEEVLKSQFEKNPVAPS